MHRHIARVLPSILQSDKTSLRTEHYCEYVCLDAHIYINAHRNNIVMRLPVRKCSAHWNNILTNPKP